MTVQTIIVETPDHYYPVYLDAGSDGWSPLLAAGQSPSLEDNISDKPVPPIEITGKHVVVITQQTILDAQPRLLTDLFKGTIPPVIVIPDGEVHKNIQTWQYLIDQLLALKCRRDSVLVALGGGVVGDIVGFAASSFYRGLSYVQIPTTLIAQVDSSVGGKTGINHGAVKNAIGAFYHPLAVLINTHVLKTLPAREFTAGLAEVIKYALIADADFFQWLEKNITSILVRDEQALLHVIKRCITLKAQMVGQDSYEKNGLRSLLNFGHTLGHALEACTNYERLLHGEAVAVGIMFAVRLSQVYADISEASVQRIDALLYQAGLLNDQLTLPDMASLIDLMAADKKVINNKLRFVLLRDIGSASLVSDIPMSAIINSLNKIPINVLYFNKYQA